MTEPRWVWGVYWGCVALVFISIGLLCGVLV